MYVRMTSERSFLKSQCSSFSTGSRRRQNFKALKQTHDRRTFGDTPEILATFDDATVVRGDVLSATDDRERHDCMHRAGVLCALLVVFVYGWLVDLDTLCVNRLTNLCDASASDKVTSGKQNARAA